MNGVEINTRAYVATRLLLRWDYLYEVTLKPKVFGDYNHARLEVSWITSTRGLLLRGHTGTSQVDFEVDCPPPVRSTTRSFHHHGKGNAIFIKKEFRKMKKVVSLLDLKEMKTRNDCEIACDCVKRANVVLHVGLCEEIFARKYTATHKPTPAHSAHNTTMTHIHTYI